MPRSSLTIRQVEAFGAFMRLRSVNRAAESMFITQPAMSRLLAECEESVGFSLFERNQRRLIPTGEAKVLYDEVKRTFLALDRIVQVAEQIRTMRRGILRIAGAPSVALHFLPEAIADFVREHEGIEVSLLADSSRAVLELVAGQNYDICIVVEAIPFPGVHLEQIFEAPSVCIMPLDHPLAARKVITPEDLADQPFVSYPETLEGRRTIDHVFVTHGISRLTHYESQLSETIIGLVQLGLGVALVDQVSAHYAQGRVAMRRFEPAIPRRVYLASLQDQPISILGEAFLRTVRRKLAAFPQL
jgi:DNA-binding transcriptional LysR family regulator